MVSNLTIFIIVFNILVSIAIPVGLAIVLKKKYNTSLKVFFVGCAVWFLFAMVLEQFLHVAVLASPAGAAIQGNIWLMALYGGLAAGVFEETGRLIAMKTILKKNQDNSYNSLMYGAGHGGFEAFFILGFAMLNNLIYSIIINNNQTDVLLASLDDAGKDQVYASIASLINTPSAAFLVGSVERVLAVLLHIALSVLVWIAVVKGKKALFPLAIFIHFLVDTVAVITSRLGMNMVLVEVIIFVMSALTAVLALHLWKKEKM